MRMKRLKINALQSEWLHALLEKLALVSPHYYLIN